MNVGEVVGEGDVCGFFEYFVEVEGVYVDLFCDLFE